jgi:dihydroxy-acid dehydratase
VPFDGLVLIPNCDKIVPGMLMAMLRLNIPSIMISGGPMLPGQVRRQDHRSDHGLRGGGQGQEWASMTEAELERMEETACPGAAPAPACSRPIP